MTVELAKVPTSTPVCSICISNYNGISIIADCINSVNAQLGRIAIEILVHDDASTDDSVAFIQAHYPQIRLISSPTNVGFCVANNRMAAAAKGDYLLLLNNDATLFPDALTTLLTEAKRIGHPAILGLPQYNADGEELLDIGSLLDPFLNPVPNLNPERGEVGMVMGACLWIPKLLWHELGGFPEWFGSIGEDLYLCCRARLMRYAVIALRNSGYRHHVGKSFGGGKAIEGKLTTTWRRRALSERNKSYVIVLIYPTPLLQIVFPLHLLLIILEGLILAVFTQQLMLFRVIYWACMKELWKNHSKLYQARREIQAFKKCNLRQFLTVFRVKPHKLSMLLKYGIPQIK